MCPATPDAPGAGPAAPVADWLAPILRGFQPVEETWIGLRSIPAVSGMVFAACASCFALPWYSRLLPPRCDRLCCLGECGILFIPELEGVRVIELLPGKAPPGRLKDA